MLCGEASSAERRVVIHGDVRGTRRDVNRVDDVPWPARQVWRAKTRGEPKANDEPLSVLQTHDTGAATEERGSAVRCSLALCINKGGGLP